jgi:excisionase family DNA binding protein
VTEGKNGTLISAEALGEQLSLPPASVRRLAREGRLPCYRAGRLLRFSVAEVLERMKDNGQQGNEERA